MVSAVLAGLAAALAAAGSGLLVATLPVGRRDRSGLGGPASGGPASGPPGGRGRAGATDRGPPLLRLLVRTGARLRTTQAAAPHDLEARIAAAGRPAGLGARELMAAKLAAAATAGVLAALLSTAAPGRLALMLLAAGPVAGFLAPDLWLARRAAERARRIRRELPALLDLLRVGVESGSSLAEALRAVGARTHGPLAAEWRAVGRQVALGVPLERALDGMAERAPLAEVRALVAALDRARRHGAPLGDALAAQARDARFALARHAREEAARAGPKIQLVVALLLVPSVLLLVAAALLAALLGGGAGGPGGALLPL
jgi:tight adherence protein C